MDLQSWHDERRALAERVADELRADSAWIASPRRVDGETVASDLVSVGVDRGPPEGPWPAGARVDRFVVDGTVARLVVHDGLAVVAVVGAARVGAWDRARLREASDAVAERVRRHARGLVAPPSAFALVGDGRIRATSDGHGAWFSARCRAVVEAATREGAERVVIGGCVGRPSRVSGPRGEAVLWRFEAVPAPRRDPAEVLSPRQLAVAGYAAVGATAEEIGRAVGISAHTARQHLKAAYRQLGVRNRVELAHALDAAELSR